MTGTAMAFDATVGGARATVPPTRWGRIDIYGQREDLPAKLPLGEETKGAAARATRMRDRVVARLRVLARYSAGWDGEQADAPRPRAIGDAINFVANLGL